LNGLDIASLLPEQESSKRQKFLRSAPGEAGEVPDSTPRASFLATLPPATPAEQKAVSSG
jgi:hypothetical protein